MTESKAHVLVVEDDEHVQGLLVAFLRASGFKASSAGDAATMWALLAQERVEAILLDLGLPDEDGLVVARQLRANHATPLIVMTARQGRADRIAALQIGANDYLVKPFDPQEMILRVSNLIKTSQPGSQSKQPHVISFAGFSLNLDARTLSDQSGEHIPLAPSEFHLLSALARAPGRVLSRAQLLDAIARDGETPGTRIIDVLVGRLRRKLGDDPKSPRLIKTISGFGYLFHL